MHIKNFQIGPVPVLLYAKEEFLESKKRSAVLMYHGSSASKEVHIKELSSLAEAGFIAIGIDSFWHGERKNPDIDNLFNHENPEMLKNMLYAVDQTAAELPLIIEFLKTKFSIPERKTAILGISMGAFIVYKAISICPQIKCAVAILGTPKYCSYEKKEYLKCFARNSLLSLNASKDQYISNEETRRLHLILKNRYTTYSKRFIYKEYRNSDHFMRPCDWKNLWNTSITFIRRNIL